MAREAAARPPAQLLRLHRRSLATVLVQGGTDRQRADAAFAFHDASPLRGAPFLVFDCARDDARLSHALESWLICDGEPDGVDPLRESDGGTLFLDEIHALDRTTQRLLQMLVRRMDAGRANDRRVAGPARLAAGSSEDLDEAVRQNRFSGALLDSLDKVRVDLGRVGSRGAA
jgi:DNA-binding NtrC family response regulator